MKLERSEARVALYGRRPRYTILDMLMDSKDRAAERLDADVLQLERFVESLGDGGLDLMLILQDLGAKSIDDLVFLEPGDLDDTKLSEVQRRRIFGAVAELKGAVERKSDRRDSCVVA